MARNQAVRRAERAIRRKAQVAAKRSTEAAAGSLSGQVRQGATLPILECLVSDRLFENGMGAVALIRGVSRADQHMAVFLVDSFCLGVKDAFFRVMDRREAEEALEGLQASDPLSPVSPEEARKLLHDLVAWAGSNGFPPHKDYARIEPLFGNVAAAATDYTARFGHEGEVLYLPGPNESPFHVRRRMQMIRSRFGEEAADRSLNALAELLADEMAPALDDEN